MNVTVNASNEDDLEAVLSLHSIIASQLELLSTVHSNMKRATHVTGISISNCENTTVTGADISGADVGIEVKDAEGSRIENCSVRGR